MRWRVGLRIFDLRLPIANWLYAKTPIRNRQLTIGSQETHPLPRGGTDLIQQGSIRDSVVKTKIREKIKMALSESLLPE
jgi:hypothetical protein